MKRKWIIPLAILLALAVGFAVFYGVCSSRLTVYYGEKAILDQSQQEDEAYLEAWSRVSDYTAACEVAWKGKWPDWFGGFGVVENEGIYLTNVYLTEDTEEHRREVCTAAGESLRAYTTTGTSWKTLQNTLSRLDSVKSIPGVNILSMGIQVQSHCVRVYLAHQDTMTTLALGLVGGPIEVVIIPAQPYIRTAVRNLDGSVSLEMGSITYSNRLTLELSTDAAFEENVKVVELDSVETLIDLPDPGEGEAWYVRARAFKDVEGKTYQSEWSAAKTVKNAG